MEELMKRMLIALTIVAASLAITGTASAAPGTDIKVACGASFGQLISEAKSAGTAFHGNYAGGAAALADPAILAAHGCAG
jgi:hypothetical protein